MSLRDNLDRALGVAGTGALMASPFLLLFARGGIDGAIGLACVSFLLHSALRREWAWLRHPVAYFAIALCLWGMLTAPLAPLMPLNAALHALAWLRFPLLYLAVTEWLFHDERRKRAVFWAWIVALAAAVVDTGVQAATGTSLSGRPIYEETRLTGPLSRPNIGMLLSKFEFALLGMGVMLATSLPRKIGVAVAALIVSLLVFKSGERSASLMLLFGWALVLGIMIWHKPRARLPLILVGLLSAAGLFLLLTFNPFLQDRAFLLVQQLAHFGETEYGKLQHAAWVMWKAFPWHGVGTANFRYACLALQEHGDVPLCNLHPHNIALEWLAETGLPGFALYTALTFAVAWPILRALRQNEGALLPAASAAALWLICFFPLVITQSVHNNWAAGLTWLTVALAQGWIAAPRR